MKSHHAQRLRGRPRIITATQLKAILELSGAGLDYLTIARRLRLNPGSVLYWLRKYPSSLSLNNRCGPIPCQDAPDTDAALYCSLNNPKSVAAMQRGVIP